MTQKSKLTGRVEGRRQVEIVPSEACSICFWKDKPPSEGWCYLHSEAPKVECIDYLVSEERVEMELIRRLEINFPDKFDN
jgi:hypothetical protein